MRDLLADVDGNMTAEINHSMQEVHYCRLETQSNVYGLAQFKSSTDENRLLVASVHGKVMSVSFQKTVPSSREVHFTYIPVDAEIISLDAFNRSETVGVVAIAFMKLSEGKLNHYLNIYSEFDAGGELDLNRIALGCQSLALNFVPYQLYHTEIFHDNDVEMVFLLSGGDSKIHLFREAKVSHTFVEEQIDEYFPELRELPGIVTRLHCVYVSSQRRLTALGCQNGYVVVADVDVVNKALLRTYRVQHDSPITSVQLFQVTERQVTVNHAEEDLRHIRVPHHHLIVTSAVELSVVYLNVWQGLAELVVLPESNSYDSALCCLAADVDFDGQSEILIGTYGQELLIYKCVSQRMISVTGKSERKSFSSSVVGDDSCKSSLDAVLSAVTAEDGEFVLVGQLSLPDPILALRKVDMTGDGLLEIGVLSLKGLHIMQHDLKKAADVCLQRLRGVSEYAEDRISHSIDPYSAISTS